MVFAEYLARRPGSSCGPSRASLPRPWDSNGMDGELAAFKYVKRKLHRRGDGPGSTHQAGTHKVMA
jgi:hypothetical protein